MIKCAPNFWPFFFGKGVSESLPWTSDFKKWLKFQVIYFLIFAAICTHFTMIKSAFLHYHNFWPFFGNGCFWEPAFCRVLHVQAKPYCKFSCRLVHSHWTFQFEVSKTHLSSWSEQWCTYNKITWETGTALCSKWTRILLKVLLASFTCLIILLM